MRESILKAVLAGLAIALPVAEFGTRHAKGLSIAIVLALGLCMLYWIWYAGQHPDLGSWALRAFINIAFGGLIFDDLLRQAGEGLHSFWLYSLGCCFILVYVVLFLVLFGPERFRREPKAKPPFSLLGN